MGIARYERRLIAYLIDEIIACLAGAGCSVLLAVYAGLTSIFWFFLIAAASAYVIFVILCTLFSSLSQGSTLGSLILGIKCVHPDGKRFGFRDSLVRAVSKGIFVAILANAIYMLASHTERSVFDRLNDSIVVYRRQR